MLMHVGPGWLWHVERAAVMMCGLWITAGGESTMSRIVTVVRANLIAWLALFVALSGTGIAASRYIITSTSQIKPSVLAALKGGRSEKGAAGAQGAQGAAGSPGAAGAQGPTGPEGIQGPAGASSPAATQAIFFEGKPAEFSPAIDVSGYTKYRLIAACAYGSNSEAERVQFRVEVSANGTHWQTPTTTTGDPTSCEFEHEVVEEPIVARYMRVHLSNPVVSLTLEHPPSYIDMSAWLSNS